jgi:hypothetical protein
MDKCMDGWVDVCMYIRMDGWMDGQISGKAGRQTQLYKYLSIEIINK